MPAIIDSYSETDGDTSGQLRAAPGSIAVGQSFTGNGAQLGHIEWYIRKFGSPTGNVYAKIYAHSGTFGSNGKPTGAPLATSNPVDAASLAVGLYQLETFTFSGAEQIVLANGTKYFATIHFGGGDASNYVGYEYDSSSPAHSGNYARTTNESTWVDDNSNDLPFYVYDNAVDYTGVPGPATTRVSSSRRRPEPSSPGAFF